MRSDRKRVTRGFSQRGPHVMYTSETSNLYLASISDLLDFSNVFLVVTKPVFGVFDHVRDKTWLYNDTRRMSLVQFQI